MIVLCSDYMGGSAVGLTTLSLLLMITLTPSTHTGHNCPENEFYDHGTDKCEPCADICTNAKYTKTEEMCQDLCPAIYAMMVDKQQNPVANAFQGVTVANDSALTPTIKTAIIVAAVVVAAIVILIGVALGIRRRNGSYRRAPVQEENSEQAASERLAQSHDSMCDPRGWLVGQFIFPAEETHSGRRGNQELALNGGGRASVRQLSPIYRPNGPMVSSQI